MGNAIVNALGDNETNQVNGGAVLQLLLPDIAGDYLV
jgi:hypothetical protein